jgi:ubiquinone/menaquinone biosynthesis C-methylase UbiE
MVDWMKLHVSPLHPEVIALQMEEAEVPLEDRVADLVYTITLHLELKHPDALLREIFRLLKERGRAAIVDWKRGATSSGPPDEERCDPHEVVKQLHGAGFDSMQIDLGLPSHFMVMAYKRSSPAV